MTNLALHLAQCPWFNEGESAGILWLLFIVGISSNELILECHNEHFTVFLS